MILLALILVILQRIFDLCLAVLSILCQKFLHQVQRNVVLQSDVKPSAQDDRVSLQASSVRKYYVVRQGFRT